MSGGSLARTGPRAALTIGVAGSSYAVSWPLFLAVIAAACVIVGALLVRYAFRPGRSVAAAGAVLSAPPAPRPRRWLARRGRR